jgi:cation diffusion facilitator CzcD-associated flavoprotein CzcO
MIETQISDPEIRKKLIPDYIFGCKQGTLSSVYFKAFADSKKAEVVREHIVGTKDKTIITGDGREYEVDVRTCKGVRSHIFIVNLKLSNKTVTHFVGFDTCYWIQSK